MWDLIVSVPDHCLSFYFEQNAAKLKQKNVFDKHITVVAGSGVVHHVSWMSSHHWITLDASHLV